MEYFCQLLYTYTTKESFTFLQLKGLASSLPKTCTTVDNYELNRIARIFEDDEKNVLNVLTVAGTGSVVQCGSS